MRGHDVHGERADRLLESVGMSHERAHEVVQLLADETHEVGTAAVMVTHDPAILGHADRVLRMSDGRLGA